MNITEKNVLDALSTVEEPDLKKDLVTLNMIRNIKITGNRIVFTIMLTTPACPLKELIRKNCENALYTHISKDIEIEIEMNAEVTSSTTNRTLLPNVRNIVAIASGKGGVGKSTITANLALALAQSGASVGVLDADISGPSIPIMFGVEHEKPDMYRNEQGRTVIIPIQRFGIKFISMGFLAPAEQAVPWRGPMASKALMQFLGDTEWGDLDYLLIDLPPGTSDIHITLTQSVSLTGAIIVTTPQKIALADALKAIAMFHQPATKAPILGLVENMAYFTPAELPNNKYYIFGENGGKDFAERNVITLLGQIPIVQSIREGGDNGVPAVESSDEITRKAFKELAQNLAQQVALKNAGVLV